VNRDPLQRLLDSGWKPVDLRTRGFPESLPCPGCGMTMKRKKLTGQIKYACTNPDCRVFEVHLKRLKKSGKITLMKITYAQIPHLEAPVQNGI